MDNHKLFFKTLKPILIMKTNSMLTNLKNYVLFLFALIFLHTSQASAHETFCNNSDETSLNQVDPNKQFLIRNRKYNKKLASLNFNVIFFAYSISFDGILDDGSKLIASDLSEQNATQERIETFQKWRFINLRADTYQIINIDSGNAMAVNGNDGTPIQSTSNSSDASQQWEVNQLNNGAVRLVNKQTGKALALELLSNGHVDLVLKNVSNDKNQQWGLNETEFSEGPGSGFEPLEIDFIVAPNPATNFVNVVITSNRDNVESEIVVRANYLNNTRNVILNKGENTFRVDFRPSNPQTRYAFVTVWANRQYIGRKTVAQLRR